MWAGAVALADLRTRRIPNWLIVIGMLVGLGLALKSGNFVDPLQGFGLAFIVGIVPFALRALGAGDVKAAMVVGLFVGPEGVLNIILATALGCGAIAWIWWTAQRFRTSNAPSQLPVGLPLAISVWILTAAN